MRMKSAERDQRELKSQVIQQKVMNHELFGQVRVMMLYASFEYEVNTNIILSEAIKKGIKVVLPRADKKSHQLIPCWVQNLTQDLSRGIYGNLEPQGQGLTAEEMTNIQWVLVPGVAFDLEGRRLGHGLGYYDRFLEHLNPKTIKSGLAFDYQITDSLPMDKHDIVLDEIISN